MQTADTPLSLKQHSAHMLFGGFLLLAILTQGRLDPTWHNLVYPADGIDNVFGVMGALAAASLTDTLGWFAYPFLVRIILVSFNPVGRKNFAPLVFFRGVASAFLFASGLAFICATLMADYANPRPIIGSMGVSFLALCSSPGLRILAACLSLVYLVLRIVRWQYNPMLPVISRYLWHSLLNFPPSLIRWGHFLSQKIQNMQEVQEAQKFADDFMDKAKASSWYAKLPGIFPKRRCNNTKDSQIRLSPGEPKEKLHEKQKETEKKAEHLYNSTRTTYYQGRGKQFPSEPPVKSTANTADTSTFNTSKARVASQSRAVDTSKSSQNSSSREGHLKKALRQIEPKDVSSLDFTDLLEKD